MKVESIETFNNYTQNEVLSYMYSLELLSNHPIGTAIKNYSKELEQKK